MPKFVPVSVIVPVHRGAPMVGRCLAAMSALSPSPSEVIVVCDGDAPEAAQLAEGHGFRVTGVSGPSGPARARNAGAGAALSPILFFVDSDVELPTNAVAQVWDRFEGDPGLAALIGSYDAEPSEPAFLAQYRNLLHHFVHQTSHPEASTFWGACGAVRREAFQAVSGFDEGYTEPSVEDIELGYRLKSAGFRILLDRTLLVKHLKRWDVRSILSTDIFRRAVPWGLLILEREVPRDLNLGRSSRWSVVATAALIAGLVGVFWHPIWLMACLLAALTLLTLNRPFYSFLLRSRGPWFAARAIPCHWLFYACGGLGFGIAILRHVVRRARLAFLGNRSPAKGPSSL